MKAELVFRQKKTLPLKFGGSITVYADCYKIADPKIGFDKAYSFSWIAFDPLNTKRRVLMDQHRGRPCHLHVEDREVEIELPGSLEEAEELFQGEVTKYFGEAEES